jgi:hypothetical protein
MEKLFPEFRCRESNCNQPPRARQSEASVRLGWENYSRINFVGLIMPQP